MAEGYPFVIGLGVITNVSTVLLGGLLGLLVGHRLSEDTRRIVTDALGLVTLLIAALSAWAVTDPVLPATVGEQAPVLIVLGALLLGAIAGSLLRLEDRIASFGGWLQRRLSRADASAERQRFIEGFVLSSLVFCVGPLTVLGSLNEGLGRGSEQLLVKSALDGFAALAFASAFGVGVLASALSVAVVQGALVLVGVAVGDVLPAAHLAAMTAVGGLILVALALRLLDLRPIRVADLLPALFVAPLLVFLVALARG